MVRDKLLSSTGQLILPGQLKTRPLPRATAPAVFTNRHQQRAEARRQKRPLLPISVNASQQCTVGEGVVLRWVDSGKPIYAGDIPAGTAVHIDPVTGETRRV